MWCFFADTATFWPVMILLLLHLDRHFQSVFHLQLDLHAAHAASTADRVARSESEAELLKLQFSLEKANTEQRFEQQRSLQLKTELERLKLALSVWSSNGAESNSIQNVCRPAMLHKAWSGELTAKSSHNQNAAELAPKSPCAAVVLSEAGVVSGRLMKMDGVVSDRSVRLRPGSHAFVVMANEPYLRVNLMASEFGTACGHPVLAAERSTLYAGWAAPTACITDCGLL